MSADEQQTTINELWEALSNMLTAYRAVYVWGDLPRRAAVEAAESAAEVLARTKARTT